MEIVTHKVCSKCKEKKELKDFYKIKTVKSGYSSECRECRRKRKKAKREAEPQKYKEKYTAENKKRKEKVKVWSLKKRYSLTLADIESMLVKQNYSCAICNTRFERKNDVLNYHTDHDHITGKIRGLLCCSCNLALGNFRDNVEILQNAIDYLQAA